MKRVPFSVRATASRLPTRRASGERCDAKAGHGELCIQIKGKELSTSFKHMESIADDDHGDKQAGLRYAYFLAHIAIEVNHKNASAGPLSRMLIEVVKIIPIIVRFELFLDQIQHLIENEEIRDRRDVTIQVHSTEALASGEAVDVHPADMVIICHEQEPAA